MLNIANIYFNDSFTKQINYAHLLFICIEHIIYLLIISLVKDLSDLFNL